MMARSPLALMAKLEKQALDRLRQELATLDARIAATTARLERLHAGLPAEIDRGWRMPDGARLVAAYLVGTRQAETALAEELARLAAERETLAEQVRAKLLDLERFELLAERAATRERAELARREAAALDELAVLRHGHAASHPLHEAPASSGRTRR